jgi:hypothetical protein
VDINPGLLNKFLRDVNKEQLVNTGTFEKEYDFHIAPPRFRDSGKCRDKIAVSFDKKQCRFRLVIYNIFFAEGCQESDVVYTFTISKDGIAGFWRNAAG